MKKTVLIISAILLLQNCTQKKSNSNFLLKKLPTSKTGVTFINEIKDETNRNILNYIYYYNGGGVAIGDINNDNLEDLFFVSNKGDNKLYLNKGNMEFEDISKSANIKGNADWQTGVTMVDINNDGYLDIYICAVSKLLGFKGHNELYINNGDNTFTEKSKEYHLDYEGYSTQAYFFDYDKDDDLDVYIVNHAVHTKTSNGPALLRKKRTALTGDVLLNNDNGTFKNNSNIAKIYGGENGYGLSASLADFNNDGWDDIYVCNDFHEDDYYYINNHDGTFTESLATSFSMISRFSMGSDAADINGDGLQDIITLDMLPKDERVVKESEGDDAMLNVQTILKKLGYQDQYARNMLQINQNANYFNEEALYNDVSDTDWSWAPLFADFDNDGIQDLFIANGILRRPNDLDFRMFISNEFKTKSKKGATSNWLLESLKEMPSGKYPNQIFKGTNDKLINQNGNWMEDVASLANGAAYADLDNDGDIDIVTNNMNEVAQILENTTNTSKNFIKIKVNYQGNNKRGIGTKVIVYNELGKQFKQLFNSRGFISSVPSVLNFGLDTIKQIDSIEVIWPNNRYQTIKNTRINKELVINYAKEKTQKWIPETNLTSKYFSKVNKVKYAHKEDFYNDFYNERLIPYKVSTSGPGFAKGDVTGNGFDDFFIGNASNSKASFFINSGKSIENIDFEDIAKDSLYEDTCASFVDVDGDNDLDLYVGTGLHSIRMRSFESDRLYRNENGQFKKDKNLFTNNNNTSCVKPYDYDNDGDIDLFVGNRSNPNNFGSQAPSYLLNNDGTGNFTPDPSFTLTSMVTDAIWEDLNKDGLKDLIVTTEWDAPKIYWNQKGKLTLANDKSELLGLWQTVTTFDIDKDGDLDILLGNWGLNTKFKATASKPLLMYHSDFDSNGKSETVLAYNKKGVYYPINSKDELTSQMNVIKKRFIKYKDFAMQPIEKVLTTEAIAKAQKYTVNELSSGYLKNENGTFNQFVKFPKALQLGPINSFREIKYNNVPHVLVFGNSKAVNTYHGGYESNKGVLLRDNKRYKDVSDLGIEPVSSQVKLSEIVGLKNEKILLIISNNDTIQQYKINK